MTMSTDIVTMSGESVTKSLEIVTLSSSRLSDPGKIVAKGGAGHPAATVSARERSSQRRKPARNVPVRDRSVAKWIRSSAKRGDLVALFQHVAAIGADIAPS